MYVYKTGEQRGRELKVEKWGFKKKEIENRLWKLSEINVKRGKLTNSDL